MKKILLSLLCVIVAFIVPACTKDEKSSAPSTSSNPGVSTLIDYSTNVPAGGDNITRGFYIEAYPGTSMTQVTLWINTSVAGSYTISLTATAATYDGSIITSVTKTFDGNGGMGQVDFAFPAEVAITNGSIVAFKMQLVSGAGGASYSISSDETTALGAACLITQTNGITPPLSTFRRNGVAIRVFGKP